MNYKELFQRLFTLIISPKKAWVEISAESPRRDVMGGFVYPLIALCGLAVLFGKLLYTGMERMTFHAAAMDICGYCVALFGGFFLAAWLLDLLRQKFLDHQSDMAGSQLFVGYAMGTILWQTYSSSYSHQSLSSNGYCNSMSSTSCGRVAKCSSAYQKRNDLRLR